MLSWTVLSAFPLIPSVLHWPMYQGCSQVERSGEYWNPTRSETTSALQGVLVGRTLIDLHHSTAVVRLMNLTGQRHKFKNGH